MKKNSYLSLSIIFLLAGIILVALQYVEFYSISLIIIGGIGTVTCLSLKYAKKSNKKIKQEKISNQNLQQNNINKSSIPLNAQTKSVILQDKESKIICKYCSCKYDKNKNKCPYCGAPQSK